MSRTIRVVPLTAAEFAPFGDVIDTEGVTPFPINAGMCERYNDLARVEATGPGAHVLINLFHGQGYRFPLSLGLVERHPFGSQAFMPLDDRPFVVIVCPDENGVPGTPRAFITRPGQGVNYHRNVWHGVLTPIERPQRFLVVDRGGEGVNLVEHHFEEPYTVLLDP